MARFNQRDIIQAISIENVARGTYMTGDVGDEFRQYPSNPSNPVLPTRTKVEDNSVGDGNPNPKKGKPYYIDPVQIPYAMALNTTIAVRFFRMLLGGTATPTTNSLPATKDYAIEMKAVGTEPMMCNIVRKLGGEAFLWGDVFVASMEFSQQGAGEPQVSATLSNSGYYKKLSDTTIDVNDIEDMIAYLKFHGAKTKLIFSDGVNSYDWQASSRLIDVSCSIQQNVIVEQLPGDPFISTAECQGAYAKSVYKDPPSAEMQAKVYMDANFDEFTAWQADRTITSVKLTFSTCEIIGATTHHFEYEIIFPKGEFNLTGDSNQNSSAFSFAIKAILGDATTKSLVQGRIRMVGDLDETVA